jgi:hypothetical protein
MSVVPFNNPIETYFEIDVTPEQLFDIANKLEHGGKLAHIGQVIRVKMNSQFCFVYRPTTNPKIQANTLIARGDKEEVKEVKTVKVDPQS